VQVLRDAEVVRKLETLGSFPVVSAETKKFEDIVLTAGIKAE